MVDAVICHLDPPSWIKDLFLQLLGLLPEDGFQLSVLFGHCLSCRKRTQPRSHALQGCPTFHDWVTGWYENLTPSSQLRMNISDLEFSARLAEVDIAPASQFGFSLCSLLLPSPPFHRCWSQGQTPIKSCRLNSVSETASHESQPAMSLFKFIHVKLCLFVCSSLL